MQNMKGQIRSTIDGAICEEMKHVDKMRYVKSYSRVTTRFLAIASHRLCDRNCTLTSRLKWRAMVGGIILADVPSFGGYLHTAIKCWHPSYSPNSTSSVCSTRHQS